MRRVTPPLSIHYAVFFIYGKGRALFFARPAKREAAQSGSMVELAACGL